jgi:membrane protein YdbS with pleckstrin-like domain
VSASAGPAPKLLRGTYLADGEALLRETRATAVFYLPAPIFWLLVFGFLDLGAASVRYSWAAIPGLSAPFRWVSTTFGATPERILFDLLSVIVLILLLWLVFRYLTWTSTVYAITTSRVIVQSGITGREFDEIPIPQVHGVDVKQSTAQRILGYGTVRITAESGTATSVGNEAWRGIPRPFEFQRMIESANQALQRRTYGGPPAPPRQ